MKFNFTFARRGGAICLALMLVADKAGTQGARVASAADSARYIALVAQVKSGDTTADFTALRMLAVRMVSAESAGASAQQHFAEARSTPDSLVARSHVDSVLTLYFGHVRAHRDAEVLFRERGDSTRAHAEATIVRGFIRSIGAQKGLTAETAMPVISIDEEYVYLGAMGVRRDIQALVKCGESRCDALTGTDTRSGSHVTYYFHPIWM